MHHCSSKKKAPLSPVNSLGREGYCRSNFALMVNLGQNHILQVLFQVVLDGVSRRLGSIAHPQLRQDTAHIIAHSAFT